MATQLIHIRCTASIRESITLENEFRGFMIRHRWVLNCLDQRLALYNITLSQTTRDILSGKDKSYTRTVVKVIPELIVAYRILGEPDMCQNLEEALRRNIEGISIQYTEDAILLAYVIRSAENINRQYKEVGTKLFESINSFLPEGLALIDIVKLDRAIADICNIRIEKESDPSGRLARITDNIISALLKILIMRNGGEL